MQTVVILLQQIQQYNFAQLQVIFHLILYEKQIEKSFVKS